MGKLGNDIGSGPAMTVSYVRYTDLNNNFNHTFSLYQKAIELNNVGHSM